jgi:choline dehydrogenase-like flavoprotein
MIYVIGSGPAGVSCAAALLGKGHKVTMLDAGIELEPERQKLIRQMSSREPDQWSLNEITALKENVDASVSGVPLKYAYGSDFAYREADRFVPYDGKDTALRPSLAKGGLSNVWGAAVLPYLAKDIADWPISLAELAPYYRSVFSFMSLAAVQDDLQNYFPLYTEHYTRLKQSHQAQEFLQDLSRNQAELNSRGIIFGSSRLAVLEKNFQGDECKTCGCCLYGCPYELIYNSRQTVDNLTHNQNFSYVKDVIVTRFIENDDCVQIMGISRVDRSPLSYSASHLYIGAGVLPTTKIVLDSLEAYDRTLTLKDSQYFLLPLLRFAPTSGAMKEDLHTLSQVFLEILDKEISKQAIHLQVYSYNDLYRMAIERALGIFYPLSRLPVQSFLERFLLIQGYLHSDLSPSISVRLEAPTALSSSRLILESTPLSQTKVAIRKVMQKLHKARHLLKAIPIAPLLKIQQPGRGFHSGGTLPMKMIPAEFETDTLGRPYGLKRVHLVDATILPSIPATTITLTIMANAFRIGAAHED